MAHILDPIETDVQDDQNDVTVALCETTTQEDDHYEDDTPAIRDIDLYTALDVLFENADSRREG